MAAPSQIPGHEPTAAVDSDGDEFPSGSVFFLSNVCSKGQQSLLFDSSLPGTTTHATQDTAERKWIVHFNNNDRSQISLKNSASGRWLAATAPTYGSQMWLSEQPQSWYVYRGAQPHTFWLGTTQSPDSFLHTWNCEGGEGAQVLLFTNRDPNSGRYYELPYPSFEEFTTGLSWQLQPTPEYRQWKASQTRRADSQGSSMTGKAQSQAELDRRGKELDAREKSVQDKESDLRRQGDALASRERALTEREQAAQQSESKLLEQQKSLKQSEADLQKQQKAVSARGDKLEAAEKRIKESKAAGPAEHLAAQEEIARLKDEKEKQTAEIESLKAQLAQAQRQPSQQSAAAAKINSLLPNQIRSPQKTMPAPSLPTGFNSDLVQRFQAGRSSMKRVLNSGAKPVK